MKKRMSLAVIFAIGAVGCQGSNQSGTESGPAAPKPVSCFERRIKEETKVGRSAASLAALAAKITEECNATADDVQTTAERVKFELDLSTRR